MKSLVLSAMICAVAVGTSVAGTHVALSSSNVKNEHVIEDQGIADFKKAITFHRQNVTVLFEQFELAKEQVRQSRGSHADLERDRAFFVKVYQDDIDAGIRIAASKKAIAEVEDLYAKKHEERTAFEREQLAKLRDQLCAELKREQKQFKKLKRKYAAFMNAETLPLLEKAEQYFADAIAHARYADADQMSIVAR